MKKALAILLVYSILMTLLVVSPFTASADEKSIAETGATSGTNGDCTWKIEDGVLTISGNGKMKNEMEGDYSPWYRYSFNTVVIENGVTSIGDYAFDYCTSLTSVTIGNSVTSIGYSAFEYCTSLTSVTIPDSVTSIGDYAFLGCEKLTSVKIPDSVTSIGDAAFGYSYIDWDEYGKIEGFIVYGYEDSAAEEYANKNHLTFIGTKGTIGDCTWKVINGKLTISGSGAIGNYSTGETHPWRNWKIKEAVIEDGITSIGSQAFYGCTSLTSATIPDSVEAIASMAFYNCTSLTSVTIPASVKDIYDKAFGYYNKEGFGETKVKDFTIYGYKNSEAELYANDNNFKFIALDDEPSDPTKTTDREIFGDIDGDGVITVLDSTFLQRYTIHTETPYPIGEKMK